MLEFIRSKTHPKNIILINAQTLEDKLDLGALLTRYSKSDKPAETLYKDEFLTNPNRRNEFYPIFNQYEDDHIPESMLYGFVICLEDIPILWSTHLLHYRTLSAIEKSTRQIKAIGYYKPDQLEGNKEYHDKCKTQLSDYDKKYYKVIKEMFLQFASSKGAQNPMLSSSINVRALDESRTLLPLSTLCSLAITANLRNLLNILSKEKIRYAYSIYIDNLIDPIIQLFKETFPTIYTDDKLNYIQKAEDIIFASKLEHESLSDFKIATSQSKGNGTDNFEIVYTHDTTAKYDFISYVQQIDRIEKIEPLREYEMIDFTITIPNVDIATFRDIQKHRYFTILIRRWDLRYDEDCECDLLSSPLSTTIDVTIKGNLRQWVRTIELRTQEQGHYNYRKIFQKCGKLIADKLNTNKEILFPYADWRDDAEIGLGSLTRAKKEKPM